MDMSKNKQYVILSHIRSAVVDMYVLAWQSIMTARISHGITRLEPSPAWISSPNYQLMTPASVG